MPYTPTNNPYASGDPYMYDLKWLVRRIKELTANYNGLNEDIIEIKTYLQTLNVEDFVNAKIDEMYNNGDFTSILQGLVDSYIATTDARLDTIEQDIIDLVKELYFIKSAQNFKDSAVPFPLEVIKKYINGISGDYYAVQGICATYNSDDSIKNIYVFCDATTTTRLYKITCGNRTNGTGWTYSYSDNVPLVHGSTISIIEDENKILIGEAANGKFYEYDIVTDTYALIDISNITNTKILGVVFDPESETFLVCADSNNKMFVIDKDYALIRSYDHNITYDTSSYLYQGYDYKHGLEYRTFNTPDHRTNGIMIYNTYDGKLVKVIDIKPIYGELESISVRNGVALLAFDGVYYDYNNIEMNMLCEAFIGGTTDENFMFNIQQKINCGYPFTAFLTNGNCFTIPNLNYRNTHNNNELCRYVGVGTASNPISSGLAAVTMALILKEYYPYSNITITLSGSNSNTDDNGFYFHNAKGMDLTIIGASGNELNMLVVNYANNVEIRAITVVAGGASRRYNDGRLLLQNNNNVIERTASTAPVIWLIDNYRVLLYQALTGTDGVTNSESYRNIYMPSSKARFTAAHFASNGDISS